MFEQGRDRVGVSVTGVHELVPFQNEEQCCGFGGAFCVTQPQLSTEIGREKLRTWIDAGVEEVIGSDMGCFMHLQGLAEKEELKLSFRHLAEVFADSI